jgi:hypothetical protein
MVFFNQIQLHHVSCLDEDVRGSISSLFSERDLPRNVYWGDGAPIEDSIISEISAIYREEAVSFAWRANDVAMLDNMLTAHSRNPFTGQRKIVVALGDMISEHAVASA